MTTEQANQLQYVYDKVSESINGIIEGTFDNLHLYLQTTKNTPQGTSNQTVFSSSIPAGDYILFWAMRLDIGYTPTFTESTNLKLINQTTNNGYSRIYKLSLTTNQTVSLQVRFNDSNGNMYARHTIQILAV